MNIRQIESHYCTAQELLSQGELQSALREAELAVDTFWKDGDEQIAHALPLLSMLRHGNQTSGDLFESLDDLPTSFSDRLLSESISLHEQFNNDASSNMMADVNRFMNRWSDEVQDAPTEQSEITSVVDEKISGLRQQITQFYVDGERDLAVESSLELANEYGLRGKNKRAFKLFSQVAKRSNRPGRTSVRINCLLDFGQFMSRIGKPADAERLLRLAAGVSRKANEKESYAHAIAALGVVLLHQSKHEAAKKHLDKAKSMLSVWDVEADIVNHHLEALEEGVSCECSETTADDSFADANWA